MSRGGDICCFDWGLPLSEEDQKKVTAKKAELGTSAMRDFAFHTAHIYCTISDTLCKTFPGEAHEIIDKAIHDYIELFGQDDYDALLDFSAEDFA